jgi:hypothetical protein
MLLENIGLHVWYQLESNLSQFARILIFFGQKEIERNLSQFARI